MSPKAVSVIEIPGAAGSEFDPGIFDPGSGRVFIAHTARSSVEVIDPAAGRHIATLPDFHRAAGAVADDGEILVTNRGSASLAWLNGRTLKTKAVMKTGPRANGAAPHAESTGQTALVRNGRGRRAAVSVYSRAIDDPRGRASRLELARPMETPIGWRPWSRYRPRPRPSLRRLR